MAIRWSPSKAVLSVVSQRCSCFSAFTPQRPCTEFLREARGLLAIYGKRHKVACPQGSSLSDHSMSVFHGFLNIPQGCVTGEVIWTGGKHCLRRTWDWLSTNLDGFKYFFIFTPPTCENDPI